MAYYIWRSYKLSLLPLRIFEGLSQYKNCFFLDSSCPGNKFLGRYSFLGIEPFAILKSSRENPFPRLRVLLARYKINAGRSGIPFLGGAVGYLSYDSGLYLEKKVKIIPKPAADIPDCFFAFYNTVIIIDHFKRRLHICAVGFPEKKSNLVKALCQANLKRITNLLAQVESGKNFNFAPANKYNTHLKSNFSKTQYLKAVEEAKKYIKAGDIYQVNLTQQLSGQSALTAFETYRRLRALSPSFFGAYLDGGDFQIISSSPERFLKLENNIASTRPMKGTRARAKNKRQDRRLRQELLQSAKDKAELMMIVDLERNDLGRVCSYDSIKVEKMRELEKYNTVFQTTANIRGHLYPGKDRVDLLRACFPGGSITGCPKIRSMEIIEELEPSRRSIYTGILGYLSFCGKMDFNILIRTILKQGSRIKFGVGGGIVADSDPKKEYEETLVKAKAMMQAIGVERWGK